MNNLNNLDFTEIKNVILRVDFNVPIDQNFIIQDFTRISRSRETIEKLHLAVLDFIDKILCQVLIDNPIRSSEKCQDMLDKITLIVTEFVFPVC